MKLTESQQKAFNSFRKGANIFLTGKGGSGKSFLTRKIIEWCKSRGRSTVVCAPTGVAALNIGGVTIHRAFGINPDEDGLLKPKKRCYADRKLEALEKADVFIIDEISMCRADVFAYVANTLMHISKKRRKQLLVVGDFYQLPPVLTRDQEEAYTKLWGDKLFAFQTDEWKQIGLQTMELAGSMRQEDKDFVSALDKIREVQPDLKSAFEILKGADTTPDPNAITICGTNKQAAEINDSNLRALIRGGAEKTVYTADVSGYPSPSDYPTDRELTLCKGAKVILLTNDKEGQWVNGTFGTVAACHEDSISVTLESGYTVLVKRNTWSVMEYALEEGKDGKEPELVQKVKAAIKQIPVKLAWAISIHKSQGATYSNANVNIENIFAPGQLYVALSRCKTLQGMHLIGKLTDEKVMAANPVKEFMATSVTEDATPTFLFPPEDEEEDDRYAQGFKDGYDQRSREVAEFYNAMVDRDPSVKRLGARATREREKDLLPPEERNPRGAGRKPLPAAELRPTKAIRVPLTLAEAMKAVGELVKDRPELTEQLIKECEDIVRRYS